MVKTILVIGATGKQGSAVIKALLEQPVDFEILALTRDPHKESAQALRKLSTRIKLIAGNLNTPRDVFRTAREVCQSPIWGVFSVQPIYIGPGADKHLEERQGKALVDAALENDVKFFVYTSVDRGGAKSDQTPTTIPHFISKHNIERYLQQRTRQSEMRWCILRPVAFFENLVPGFMGKVFATNLKKSLKRAKKLQFVATSDIGRIAALAFASPTKFENQKISIAGDELSYMQFKQIFKNITGQKLPTTLRLITSLLNLAFGELGTMFRWFGENGYDADIASVREINPRLKDFAAWLREDSQFTTEKVAMTFGEKDEGIVVVVKESTLCFP